ncbi:uncharacterized protein JCM6883_005720 [Sporobolomyces salmoneus]|uniref:uncharacterized protein n=1 Tax=Sporobolomyces salmoneus TaxID=183962 RepID=UPI003178149B
MQAGRIRLVGHRVNSNPHGSTESCAEGRRQLVEFVDLARVAWYGGSHPTWIRYREGREYRYHSGQNRWFFYDEKYFYDKEYLGSISAITTAWEWMMESNDTIRVRCQHGDELWRLSLGFSNNERLNPQLAFEFLNQLIKMQRGTPLEVGSASLQPRHIV